MDSHVSKGAVIDAISDELDKIDHVPQWVYDRLEKAIQELPTAEPNNGLQKLADEIASFKRCFKSENSDYLTGYLSALSVVEGMIAEMREVTE